MFKDKSGKNSHSILLTATVAALLALSSATGAQETQNSPQTPVQPAQTQEQPITPPASEETSMAGSRAADKRDAETASAKPAGPLYREYKGVTLGMSADEVRAKLGKPEEKSDEMDFFVFSNRERARVYYQDGKASAVIATYIGKDAQAPAPAAVLGTEIEARADGSMYRMMPYPDAGYWVAYSRTTGDSPLVIITMHKTP